MLSSDIMEKDSSWMRTASEDDLRAFVKVLDANESHPRHGLLVKAFDKECNRRSGIENERRAGGEWI